MKKKVNMQLMLIQAEESDVVVNNIFLNDLENTICN